MKHNKKRNTAFLYECLVRSLTKSVIRESKKEQQVVKAILKEFFTKEQYWHKSLKSIARCLNQKN